MAYITTKVHTLKSYPTYQFSAVADSAAVASDDVFKICILETMRWIRSRLSDHSSIPAEIDTPEPENYSQFANDRITSFSYESGFQIDMIYIEELGVWSFRISEPDMGANPGKENERAPVNGRSFTTEIAFLKQNDKVSLGIRTICSEPSDNQTDCEVFRPRIVRALADNPDIRLIHSGFIINGEPLTVKSKSELDRFIGIYKDEDRSLPLIIFADTTLSVKTPMPQDITTSLPSFDVIQYKLSGKTVDKEQRISISPELLQYKTNVKAEIIPKKQKTKPAAVKPKTESKTEKPPLLDYKKLSYMLSGYAIVVFVEDKFIGQVVNKTNITIKHGDIITVQGQNVTDRLAYSQYGKNIQTAFDELYAGAVEMPKRSKFCYGDVLFSSEAKQKEYHTKRKTTSSLEERCELYRLERDDLNKQIKELKQQQTDMAQTAVNIRMLQKRIASLESALADKTEECDALKETLSIKENSYRRSSELIQFYQQLYELAASFPKDKNAVCDWIESSFSDEIIVAPRAASEMRKYSGSLDLFSLCDGILYLSAYAKYRQQKITLDELELYAARSNWEIQGCGKEALKMFRTDYSVTFSGSQYTLDQHIKRGNQSEELIRIYFCWASDLNKIIIGSMPEHLPTVKNST
ncbi:hypothetical protein [Ruminococcus sp. NK3A76]|uniref:hypothetical protein n=1 Tax=Ruminococcus sp. NK3A76 TaxID=877411 RepID=UPI00048E44AF|nr:hypothetical protein [Ruminococcus sp. NK3A76]